jgi:polyribonucleotide nucleotidyltransferase
MIDPEKIGKLIGPGGKTIRGIQERTGAVIEVENDGTVNISTADGEAAESARSEIEALTAEIKVGSVYEGKVVSIKDFGAFIELAPGTDGMCHISELDNGYVEKVENVVKLGDVIKVKVINVDDSGRIKLSRKALLDGGGGGGGGGGGDDKRGDDRRPSGRRGDGNRGPKEQVGAN